MSNLFYKKFIIFITTYLMSGVLSASDTAGPYPNLTMHGESYENSCALKKKQELMRNIQKNVVQDAHILQTAIDLILCGDDTPQNKKKVTNLIDRLVTATYEGTGEDKVVEKMTVRTEVAKDIMARGRAWRTTLQFNNDEVTVQYFSDEACVESVKLRHSRNSWLVFEIGGACD